jgi:T-complex protein 1 subunit theta
LGEGQDVCPTHRPWCRNRRDTEGTIKRAEKAKVTVFGCGLEASSTETKGTVLIRNAEDLMSYNKGEEKLMEDIIK